MHKIIRIAIIIIILLFTPRLDQVYSSDDDGVRCLHQVLYCDNGQVMEQDENNCDICVDEEEICNLANQLCADGSNRPFDQATCTWLPCPGGGNPTPTTRPMDICGNGICEGTEHPGNCHQDCGYGYCGDAYCSEAGGESPDNCMNDCGGGGCRPSGQLYTTSSQCCGASQCTNNRCSTVSTPTPTRTPTRAPSPTPAEVDLAVVTYVDNNNNGRYDEQGFIFTILGIFIPYNPILHSNPLFEYVPGIDDPVRTSVSIFRTSNNRKIGPRWTNSTTGQVIFADVARTTYRIEADPPNGYQHRSNNPYYANMTESRTVHIGFLPESPPPTVTPPAATPTPSDITESIEGQFSQTRLGTAV